MSTDYDDKKCPFGAFLDIIDEMQKFSGKKLPKAEVNELVKKKCQHCGKLIESEARTCRYCGKEKMKITAD